MSSIRGVNVGGNLFDVTDSSNVAPIQLTNFATRTYVKDRCFIMADGLLYRATVRIESGDPIVINGNCKRTTLDEIISVIETDSDLIAPTEDDATSSDDYVIGDEIIRSGILYKVIDAISQGDAFAIGSNIDIAGSLTSQIKTLVNNDDVMLNILGAKNIGAFNFITQTKTAGIPITFTANADGTVVVSGTGTAEYVNIYCYFELKKGSYILSGCPSGGGENTYDLALTIRGITPTTVIGADFGEGVAFTLSEDTIVNAFIEIQAGYTFSSNVVFNPMIRPASIEDDTYVPHAMTNRELTDLATVVKGAITPATGVTVTSLFVEKYGKIVTINGYIIANVPSGSSTNLFMIGTIEDGFRPKTPVRANVGIAEHAYDVPTHFAYLTITTDGEIQLKTARTGASAVYFSLSYTTN